MNSLDDMRRFIGARIREERVQRRFTMRDVSLRTGISLQKLDRYEMGRCTVRLEVLWGIAQAMCIDTGRFFLPADIFLTPALALG